MTLTSSVDSKHLGTLQPFGLPPGRATAQPRPGTWRLDGVPGGVAAPGHIRDIDPPARRAVVIRSPAISWIAWVIAVPVFVLTLFSWLTATRPCCVGALLEGILYFYGAGGLIVYMLGDERVTIDELFAVGATFTLLAWGFAYMYMSARRGARLPSPRD